MTVSDAAGAAPLLIAGIVGALLLLAAWHDVASRLIPDWISVAIAFIGFAGRAAEDLAQGLSSFAMAIGLFLLLLPAAARGALGGGDVKLACACVLGLAPCAALDFIVATVLSGGVLGVLFLAGRAARRRSRFLPPARGSILRRVARVEFWRLRRGGPLPYAVAIAAGGLLVHAQPPCG
jgi:prepilin peptidase CpaA